MNKKGFTLIELLAVIVILAVIALIATPVVMDSLTTARKGSAKDSGYGFIKAIETSIMNASATSGYTAPTLISTGNIAAIPAKGTKPTEVSLNVVDGAVTTGTMTINTYVLTVAADGTITTP